MTRTSTRRIGSVPAPANRRRSRRLRKKLHLGEFRELGFELALQLRADLDAAAEDAFWHAFIVDCIEARGLSYGGASTGYVRRAGRGSASAADQDAVRHWLAQRPEVVRCEAGSLEDAWYPASAEEQEGIAP